MAEFVEMLRLIRGWRRDTALVTEHPLKSTELAPGYSVQQWISASGANRDRWRLILAIQNRAPYRSVLPAGVDDEVDYRYDGRRASGFGAAHLADGLAVSLPIDPVWDAPWVAATRTLLSEDVAGKPALIEDEVPVRHASDRTHVHHHKSWVEEVGHQELTSGIALWKGRLDHFPQLDFLPRVADDLRDLRPDWIGPVANVLLNLQRTVADWQRQGTPMPAWRSKVSPESASREHLCQFEDLDGQRRLFEWHARFTPGPGRLHFRLVPESRTIRVAYIGRKLGS